MTDLITRLSKLDAPAREADNEIHLLFFADDIYGSHVPPFTASVDAAIALAERVLPERVARRLIIFNSSPAKAGFDGTPERGKLFYYEAATPAIAACIALLRAKEAGKP